MKRMPFRAIRSTFAAIFLCFATTSQAGGPFEDALGADPAAIAAEAKITMMNGDNDGLESGRGLVPYLKKLGKPPARVALVSFYIWDVGNTKEKSYSIYGGDYVYRINNTRSFNVGTREISVLANELHDAAIPQMKQAFAAVGMQLLTAPEFLDTPEKQQAYASFQAPSGGFSGLLRTLQSATDLEWSRGVPDGYRMIELTTSGDVRGNNFRLAMNGMGIGKFANAVGHDLATSLGVDAVVILYDVVQADKKGINMRGLGLYMFGPNPIADSGQSMYYSGHQYSGVYLRMKEIPFVRINKDGAPPDVDYEGFGTVAGAVATRMAQHVKGKTG